jgi:hypothetical protein
MKKILVLIVLVLFVFTGLTLNAVTKKEVKKVVKIEKKVTKKIVCDTVVYVKKDGKKYHKKNCKLVKEGKKGITLKEALKKGYTPCAVCKPVTKPVKKTVKKVKEVKKEVKKVKKEAKKK